MRSQRKLQRRQFLQNTAAGLGLAGLMSGLGAESAPAADPDAPMTTPSPKTLETLLKTIETQQADLCGVNHQEGKFLKLLVRAVRAQNVLEIGTANGYATLWLAWGLEETGGKLTTMEILRERMRLARQNLEQAGLIHRVTFLEGDAHRLVPNLDGPFDLVFLDADKRGTLDYFHKLHPKKLAPIAMLLVHNAIRQAPSLEEFVDQLTHHPEFDTVGVSVTLEDGFVLSVRKQKPG